MGFKTENVVMNLLQKIKAMVGELKEGRGVDMIHWVQEKVKELFPIVENYVSFSMSCLGKVFPPETTSLKATLGEVMNIMQTSKVQIQRWIHFGHCLHPEASFFALVVCILKPPFALVWKIITACIRCIIYILRAPFVLVWKIITCNGKLGKMMKAPGRDYMMPRRTFEANPKAYFRDLRTGR
ncbi:OLC1v1032568C1 [Oldenlandia corymbosa var. corymbosa]|uniref:OLC1v1032568C1 n=1 Tax=Oldenlandia corymbosa var. corymbosa TaxID=529605 RepID=A0AAV1CM16_OLDCO|nr:OLC1v1032568C1 [Oldenlandia corymbosa var. corymbosa]